MKKIGLVTYSGEPLLTGDDRLVFDSLKRFGADAQIVNWDAEKIDWRTFDAVVLRSCWEYHLRTDEFLSWTGKMEGFGVKLLNSPETVRRNIDKFYLKDLAARGAAVPAAVWLKKGERLDLKKILEANEWSKAVIKPAVSMSAFQTWITSPERSSSHQRQVERILETSGVIIQKFIEEVERNGEWSFVFLGGDYSHAVLKRPRKGDFRVQRDFGGTIDESVKPAEDLIEQAREIYRLVKEPLLYARVDGVVVDGAFNLMELELIDPVLFLKYRKDAPEKFARAILSS